jgi:GNAT superfamily N-acetyltransferase
MATITDHQEVQIVPYREEYAGDFARLNFAWLEGYALLEDADRKYLEDPQTHILDGGGEIFFALSRARVIATCAAIWHNHETIELAKLAVSPSEQGRGLGRRMSETVIQFARQAGARKIILLSSTKLVAALRLYESLGFHYALAPTDVNYETADVYMEMEFTCS